jgi:integrase
MARPATGEVKTHVRKDGLTSFALRFRAYGQRRFVTLGTDEDGWTPKRAAAELRNTLARVDAGIWRPEESQPIIERQREGVEPTLHRFASDWLEARRGQLSENTYKDYLWRLTHHLLPFFRDYRPSEVDIELVDRYRAHKLAEREEIREALSAGADLRDEHGNRIRPLSNRSINMTLTLLGAILETAVEYKHLASNPARGRRRRVPSADVEQTFLEADQAMLVLDAAGELDREARADRKIGRRAMMALLVCAGVRVSELGGASREHVDLGNRKLYVSDAKTPSGVRKVDLTPRMVDELVAYLHEHAMNEEGWLFPTASGRRRNKDNVNRHVVRPAVLRARALAAGGGVAALPGRVTPHTLRRTYISMMLEAGASVPYVMGQVGHAHPDTTLRIYAKVLNRDRSALGQAFDDLMEGAVPAAGSDARAGFGQTIGQTAAETELDRLRAEWEIKRK